MQAEKALDREVQEIEYSLEGDLKSFGKGFTVLEKVSWAANLPVGSTFEQHTTSCGPFTIRRSL